MTEISEDDVKNMTPEQVMELQVKNCIFCKIISGEIPSKKVYEDPDFVAILDINPATDGHVLVLPRKHVQILPHLSPEVVGKLGVACKNVSEKILKGFGVEGTTVFVANGQVAGQKAPHLIVHIIPRKEGDGIPLNPVLREIDDNSFNDIKLKLMTALGQAPPKKEEKKPDEEKKEEEQEESEEDEVDLDKISELFT